MNDYEANSVIELLETIKKFQREFGELTDSKSFIFRGAKDKEYSLLPGVFRSCYQKQATKEFSQETCETGAIHSRFEYEILSHYSKSARAYLPPTLHKIDFPLLQYAQHYGVPTRLLDFTDNPLVALFFCCESKSETDGALWVINTSPLKRWSDNGLLGFEGVFSVEGYIHDWSLEQITDSVMSEISSRSDIVRPFPIVQRPVFFIPPYIDQRMSAQSSCFLIWGRQHEPLESIADASNLMQLNGMRSDDNGDQRFLARIIIPAPKKRSIMKELDVLGVNEKLVFPGLDGIGRYIEKHYRHA
ncbi:MAG: FRG domain-containing protein [Coriobacteriia bacterium]|nr:FRG domain-containing protein [Coriobacteriia bacterium]MCL2749678.1 FRG domain-containing protein [Coriobacteriia bacterium]